MKELGVLVNEIEKLRAAGKGAVLATVVGVAGSAYRLPGARMLVTDERWIAGSISGGCLEGDVVLRAPDVLGKNEAVVVTYDTTSDEDIIFGVGLGCRGVITVLIEPVKPETHSPDLVRFIKNSLARREAGVMATVVDASEGVAVSRGARLTLGADGQCASDVEDRAVRAAMQACAERHAADAAATLKTLTLPNGTADVFVERITPATPLVVFGAGHDAIPVVRLAKELGWHVTVVDHRPNYAAQERFPLADRVLLSSREGMPADVKIGADTLALIMTHNYLRDLTLLKVLLRSPAPYVGLLGPKKRRGELLAELKKEAIEVAPEHLRHLYAPVGLDIGAEGPEGVALSIVAEMQAVVAGRAAGHLRERRASIHGTENSAKTGEVRSADTTTG